MSITEGGSASVGITTVPSDLSVMWSSSNTSVATVDNTGCVTAVKAGKAIITASASGAVSQTCTVYVTLSQNAVYRIRNKAAAVYLDCNGANIAEANLTNIKVKSIISSGNERLAQLWRLTYVDDGYYFIRPMHKLDYGLYIDNGDVKLTYIGTNNTLASAPEKARWTIEYIDGGYVFKCAGSIARTLQPFAGVAANNSITNATAYDSTAEYQKWLANPITPVPIGCLIYDLGTGKTFDIPRRGIRPGQTLSITDLNLTFAFYSANDISQTATWTSSSPGVATVNSTTGAVTGVANGQATITATKMQGGVSCSYSFELVVSPLPISGYELEYDPESWNDVIVYSSYTISKFTNCYAYVLNNQIDPCGDQFGCTHVYDIMGSHKQQPGKFYNEYRDTGDEITTSNLDPESYIIAVEKDFETYNSIFGTSLVFERMDDPEEPCPSGMYKVAFVFAQGIDYHWYRQNPDGSWSHKQGESDVTDKDNSGHLIMDPRTADLGIYDDYIAFFYVSAWNNLYVGDDTRTSSISLSQSNPVQQNTQMIDDNVLSQIQLGMSQDEVIACIGFGGVDVGSGTIIHKYQSTAGTDYHIVYQIARDGIYRVTHILGGETG